MGDRGGLNGEIFSLSGDLSDITGVVRINSLHICDGLDIIYSKAIMAQVQSFREIMG